MPSEFVVKNVSGEGMNCFFRSLTGSFGKEYIRKLLNLEENQSITATAYRKWLGRNFDVSEYLRIQYINLLSITHIDERQTLTVQDISRLLSVSIPVAECIKNHYISRQQSYNDTLQCIKTVFVQNNAMVGQAEVQTFQHYINYMLSDLDEILIIASISQGTYGKMNGNSEETKQIVKQIIIDYIPRIIDEINKSATRFNTMYIEHSEYVNREKYLHKRIHFLITDNIHYNYIVKIDEQNDRKVVQNGIPLGDILAYKLFENERGNGLNASNINYRYSPTIAVRPEIGFGGKLKKKK